MIEFKNISKSYGNQEVIKDFNLIIECGTFLTIIGSSGSGKTTILKMINGLIKADKGEVLINNKNIQDKDLIELRRKIGYVIQGNILFPHLTVFENIAYVLNLKKYDKKEIEKIVNEKMDMLNLSRDLKDRLPDELSGGQQQRVGIARALAANPDIILMDEPFGAVDAITRYQLQKDLKELHRKTEATIVFITHDITEALKLGTKVLVLDKGEVLINDKNIQDEDLIELRRKKGYVIQGNILFPHLTVFDNIAYVLNLKKYDKKEIEKIVNEKMDMLNLSRDLKDRLPDELSGGQQQRVGIARALVANPDIILMDEPFGAVDAITRYQLQKDLKDLHKKTEATIVFITHDITEALKLGTKVLVLDKGEIQQYDIPKNICSNPKNEFVKQLLKMAEM